MTTQNINATEERVKIYREHLAVRVAQEQAEIERQREKARQLEKELAAKNEKPLKSNMKRNRAAVSNPKAPNDKDAKSPKSKASTAPAPKSVTSGS